MNMSERYYRSIDKIGSRSAGLSVTVQAVEDAFDAAIGKVPDELARGIFLHFLDSYNKSGQPESEFVTAAYRLGAFIDLFWMEYDDSEDTLTEDDWEFLRESVNEAAGDLDLKLLTYVMQKIVEKGKI